MTGRQVHLRRLRAGADRLRRAARVLAGERGGISPFLLIMFFGMVGFAGLTYDAGNLFAARREANNVAAAAARAGANDLTEESIYAGNPELAATAPATAMGFALLQGADTAIARRVEHDRIEVQVTRTVDFEFFGLFGIGPTTVTGESQSRVRDSVSG